MIPLAFGVEEDLRFTVGARDSLPVPRVNLQTGKSANFHFQHFDKSLSVNSSPQKNDQSEINRVHGIDSGYHYYYAPKPYQG